MPDMNTGSVFVDNKSTASIRTHEDVFRTRYVLDHYARKDFAKLFRSCQLADPHDRVHNAKAIDKCRRWLEARGMGQHRAKSSSAAAACCDALFYYSLFTVR